MRFTVKGMLVLGSLFAACAVFADPVIVSHRGGRTEFDDNAAGGFRFSLENGVRGFETDIRLTADNQLVIMHDDKVERTTTGTGIVEKMPLEQIRALRLKRSQEHVPSLEDLLAVFQRREGIMIELEMKTGGYSDEANVIYCKKIHETANRLLAPGTFIFTSFDVKTLATMRKLFPDAPIGLIIGRALDAAAIEIAKGLKCKRIAPLLKGTPPELVKQAHEAGITLTGWMVNSLEDYEKAKAIGFDYTTSDIPVKLLKEVQSRKPALPAAAQ
ncbi:MAG: glycerophosphodiester phosphodiesterase [Kiritimatiellae bacterium]|nr:glycerophosphodiester phosphodiesterase [Kiritimatiellia bacterium]